MALIIRKIIAFIVILNIALALASITVFAYIFSLKNHLQKPQRQDPQPVAGLTEPDSIAIIGAGIAVAGSTVAAGIALGSVAKAGLAALVEKPDLKTWVLILGGLAEGIAIYGLLLAILILGRIS